MELAERLARYALSLRYPELDAKTVRETKGRIIDALGCAVGAFDEPPVAMARKAVSNLGHARGATIIGTGSATSPDLATFVNGLMVRYFDYNDTYLSKEPAHPSDNLAPCFAVGEAEDSGGKDVMAAAVAAYEVQCRLCDAADIRHRGWDHVNYGLVSAPLAASRLMGLGVREATHSVNIALNAHIAMRQVRAGELSMWKGASFANAARNGVFAATLAREGMTGPAPIFEGEMGFFRQVSGPFELDVEAFGRSGGYKIDETYVKYWPAEYHAQTAIWAALELRKKITRPGEVESVMVETHEAGYTILGKDREKWDPKTKETADHSLPYIVAMALLKGTVDNSTYSDRNLSNPRNLDFVRRVKVTEDPLLTAMYPAKGMPNRVKVKMTDGREISAQVDVPRGHPLNPMSTEEIEKKFIALTSARLGERKAKGALRRLWRLDEEKDLSELLSLLRVSRGSKA
ncbi:MAG: MmgE/PrpD family protein [Nitrososphaerota archaeon]|nr:MmgE/PrpD family protein [Nitrososphaerota archaeon]MDG7024489.1 MmgE/PrpD family protein [Nitrososphaerota archaeon]